MSLGTCGKCSSIIEILYRLEVSETQTPQGEGVMMAIKSYLGLSVTGTVGEETMISGESGAAATAIIASSESANTSALAGEEQSA